MHANEVFNSVTAPIHGAQRGLPVRAVFGQVATLHLNDDSLTGRCTGREIPIPARVLDAPPKLHDACGELISRTHRTAASW